jgi:hypothetical protein
VHVPGGFDLMCNRDENRTRRRAMPPTVRELRGVRFIAPTDGDFGGTWVGANEFGIAVSLLNRYEAGAVAGGDEISRGLLVLDLMDAQSRLAVRERLGAIVLSRFRPFTLVALAPGEPALVAKWTGRTCLFEYDGEYSMPLVSSAVDGAAVEAWRRGLLVGEPARVDDLASEDLDAFHRSHDPSAGSYSVCMHRDDAETVSLSHVSVRADSVRISYTDGAPCVGTLVEPVMLERAPLASVR